MQIIIILILVIIIAYLIYSQYEGFANTRRNRISSQQNRGIYVNLKKTPQRKASDIPLSRPDRPHKPHRPHNSNNSWDYHGGYSSYYNYPLNWYNYIMPWNWNYLFYPYQYSSLYDPYFTPAFDYSDNCHEKCADRYMNINNDFEYNAKVAACINENCY